MAKHHVSGVSRVANDEKWMQIARKAVRNCEGKSSNSDAYWWSMTIDREDVLQAAVIAAWKEWEKGEKLAADVRSRNTYVAARSGIKNYLRDYLNQIGANEKLENLIVGLNDEEIAVSKRRGPVNLSDVTDGSYTIEQASKEVIGEEMQRREEQNRLRSLIEKAAKARLTRREKRVLYMRYGIGMFEPLVPCEIAMELDISQAAVYGIIDRAEEKLKAELKAEEIFGENAE